jgi:3'-5' exoribonuclease
MIKSLVKGDVADIHALVEKMVVSTAKNGKPYATLTLRDKSGAIQAKIWNFDVDRYPNVKEGAVLQVVGPVDEYNGAPQMIVNDAYASTEPYGNYVNSTRFNIEQMWTELVALVDTFTEPLTKYVTEEILLKHADFIELFKKAPAAKTIHNNWHGGLIEHVHSLCTIAEPVIKHYQKRYGVAFSRDKVLFGLMLHDAAKVIEYDFSKPTIGYSALGQFTPHIVIGPAWVYEKANKCPAPPENFKVERAHLMHILAAHHGQVAWGSPVVPASLEAILVHQLDYLDAKMLHAIDLIEGKTGPVAGFSERSYFEKASFYQYGR